jgi:hypothetical protein
MNIVSLISKPLLAVTPDKEINYNPLHQLGLGILMAGLPVGSARLMSGNWKHALPLALGGFSSGISALPLHNSLVRLKKEQQLNEIKKAIEQHINLGPNLSVNVKSIGNKIQNIHKKIAKFPDLSKQAGFGSYISSKIGQGAILAGTAVGTYKGINYLKHKQPYNYNTMLRNNILYGKIKPEELNSNELQEVKQLGWK